MPNTLDLDPEFGDVDMLEALESAFDIKFDPGEIKRIANVGSLFDIVAREVTGTGDLKKCASAMTFYRLRRALRKMRPGQALTPSTSLIGVDRIAAKRFLEMLRHETSLNTPRPVLAWFGSLGAILLLLTVLAFLPVVILANEQIIDANWGYGLAAAFALGCVIVKLDWGRLPKDCSTLGGLANKMAVLNYGKLIKLGARTDENALWNAFVELLRDQSELPKDEIRRDTVFFRNQLKVA